ncbi:MAG: enoyl-CoA hydratase/isomerase family protein [Bacillota bacterium]|nr:enoyl-CoA hydratase/isomerase family protein [Bacillota bacterium]
MRRGDGRAETADIESDVGVDAESVSRSRRRGIMTEYVVLEKKCGVAVLTIQRPEKLNALSLEVIEGIMTALEECRRDDSVRLVLFEGAGERAFCAGGDVKSVYELGRSGNPEAAETVFRREFEMDFVIADFPKVILSYLDGITMGGGVGMSISTDFRVVTERTKWAMPEMKIGLFPDVGTSYYLSKLPNGMGHYVCLTSKTIDADDCLYLGVADYKIRSSDYASLKADILRSFGKILTAGEVAETLKNLLRKYACGRKKGYLEMHEALISKYFDKDSLDDVTESLRTAASRGEDSEFIAQVMSEFDGNSPTSMAVVMEQHRRARDGMTVRECLDQDYVLVRNFLRNHDFYEGVRTLLVEKSGTPMWNPKHHRDVDVLSYFRSAQSK